MNGITSRVWVPLFIVCNHLHHPIYPVQVQSLALLPELSSGILSPPNLHSQQLERAMAENLSHSSTMNVPKPPLSMTDAVPILFKELEAEREHTNAKLARIVESNGQVFQSLISEFSVLQESCKNTDLNQLTRRVSYLESALHNIDIELKTNVEIFEESIANACLRSETTSMYLEQLLYNLKKGLFETLSSITQEKCCPCKSTPSPTGDNQDMLFCSLCDKIFDTTVLFTLHMAEQHQSQVYSCGLCEMICRNSETLSRHLQTHHRIHNTAKCPVCDHIFMNNDDLQSHLNTMHAVPCPVREKLLQNESAIQVHMTTDHAHIQCDTEHNIQDKNSLCSFTCEQCLLEFPKRADLRAHIQANHDHSQTDPGTEPNTTNNKIIHLCDKCERTFEQFGDLTEHIGSIHTQDQSYACEDCESVFECLSLLETHLATHHVDIPQVDGPIQEVPDHLPQDGVHTRTATYALNKKKQIKEITKDAMLVDFDITVNNNDENCTIKCSSGFYLQVAKASFLTLDDTSTITFGNVAINIGDIKITNDETGFEANRLIRFTFSTRSDSCGSATVHLHHSTRTIQVQGSAIMPDKTKAAFWFVSKIILKRFQDLAKAKQYAIKNFNNLVRNLKPTSNHPNTKKDSSNINYSSNSCQHCLSRFSATVRPSVCTHCGKYFHKRNCLKEHMKSCLDQSQQSIPGLSAATVSSTPQLQSLSSTTATYTAASLPSSSCSSSTQLTVPARPCSSVSETPVSIPGLRTAVITIPVTSTDTALVTIPTSEASLISSTSAGSSLLDPSIPSLAQTVPTLNLDSPPATASVSALNPSFPRATAKVSRKGKSKTIPVTNEDISVEFLQRELAAAQARIVQLDVTVKDKEQQVSILMARVNSLEEAANNEIYERYFPRVQPTSDQPHQGAPTHSPSHQPCYFPPSCCNHSTQCCQSRLGCPPSHHHGQQQHPCQHQRCAPQTSPLSDNVTPQFLKLQEMINEVKDKIDAVEILQRNTNSGPRPTDSTLNFPNPQPMTLQPSQSPENSLDETMTSVENDIPENPLETQPLNYQSPTIQLE